MDSRLMERYNGLKSLVVDRRREFCALMDFLERETSWLEAPASTRFHLCGAGGLLEHSCNVAETLLRIKAALAPQISDESCVIVALLHDAGKAGVPGEGLYIKSGPAENGEGYGYPAGAPYRFNSHLTYLSVPVRSLYLCLPRIRLTEDEVQAIVYHDGQYVQDNRSVAANEEPLTLLLQYADSWSGFVMETRKPAGA